MSFFIHLMAVIFLIASALLIFRRVRTDYLAYGKLTPFSSFLEVLIFFLHGSASYLFLDSNLSHVNKGSMLFLLSLVLILGGVLFVALAMSRLGLDESVGKQATGLQQSGLYRYSRNPQIVAYFFVVVGYALLWPSWSGIVWVAIYTFIAQVMVRTEEEHLGRVYGEDYRQYCQRIPRYIGVPKRQ